MKSFYSLLVLSVATLIFAACDGNNKSGADGTAIILGDYSIRPCVNLGTPVGRHRTVYERQLRRLDDCESRHSDAVCVSVGQLVISPIQGFVRKLYDFILFF